MEWPTKTITDYGMATKTITDYGMANKNNNRLWNGQQKQ
jgi:hypothetical protein